jgi:hypothetical protein
VLAAGALVRAGEPEIQGRTLRVGALQNPISRNSYALAPAGPVRRLDAEGDLSAVRGRVAIVGSMRGDVDLQRSPDGLRYGVEILAAEVQTLVRQAAPRELGPELASVLTLLVGLGTWLMRRFAWVPAALAVARADRRVGNRDRRCAPGNDGEVDMIAATAYSRLSRRWSDRRSGTPLGEHFLRENAYGTSAAHGGSCGPQMVDSLRWPR